MNKWNRWSLERLSNLSKITQPLFARARFSKMLQHTELCVYLGQGFREVGWKYRANRRNNRSFILFCLYRCCDPTWVEAKLKTVTLPRWISSSKKVMKGVNWRWCSKALLDQRVDWARTRVNYFQRTRSSPQIPHHESQGYVGTCQRQFCLLIEAE